jgi:hypothetical protein
MTVEELERFASDLISETRFTRPANMFLLADACGLLLTPVGAYEERFDGRELHFDAYATHHDQQEWLARCIARWALSRAGYFPLGQDVSRLSHALLRANNVAMLVTHDSRWRAGFVS